MECKFAQYWISLYLDDQLEEDAKNELLEHIEDCNVCRRYYEQALEIDNSIDQLFEESIPSNEIASKVMRTIRAKEVSFKPQKRWSMASIAAVMLTAVLVLLPINGKTVLAHVNDWVKSLTIKQPGLVIKVEDARTPQIAAEPNGIKIARKVDEKYLSTQEEVLNVACELEKKPCLPVFMLEDYEFDYAYYGKHFDKTGHDFYVNSYYIRKSDDSTLKDNISVKLSYEKQSVYTIDAVMQVSDNDFAKELSIDDEKGVIIKRDYHSGFYAYEVQFFLNKYGVNIDLMYRVKEDKNNIEKDIISIFEPLIKQIKQDVPENKPMNVSSIIKSTDLQEFHDTVKQKDDRIIEINNIPEDYLFNEGMFIDNSKDFNILALPSDYISIYQNGSATLTIEMNLHSFTEINSDLHNSATGEVVKRELLEGYEIKIYKDMLINNNISRLYNVDMRDYAVGIYIRSTGAENELLSEEEIREIIKDIIYSIKKQAVQRETKDLGVKSKIYDNLDAFINSEEIKQDNLPIPTYLPEKHEFMRAEYENNSYLLQFSRIMDSMSSSNLIPPSISIKVRKDEFYNPRYDEAESDIKAISISGREGYMIKEEVFYNEYFSTLATKLEIELSDIGCVLEIIQTFHENENPSEELIFKLAESIINNIN